MSAFSLSYTNDELRLFQIGATGQKTIRVALPAGLVRMGRINNPNSFAQVVQQTMQNSGINSNAVIVGLPEEQAFVKLLTLPDKLSASELRSTIEYQWQNILPIPTDQVYYDCCYMRVDAPKTKKAKGSGPAQRPVLVVAYPREIVTTLLVIFRQLNINPELFIPQSFGYARLFSPKSNEPILLIDTQNGQDITVMVAKDQVTLFSTTLHTSVDDPKLAKQIINLKEYYDRVTDQTGGTINRMMILPNPYTGNLQQTLTNEGLQNEVVSIATLTKNKDTSEIVPFVGLIGLIKDGFRLSILPPELQDDREVRRQRVIARTMATSMLTITAIVMYFSLVFYLSLQLNARTKVQYSPLVSQRITEEGIKTAQQVNAINLAINRLTPLLTRRTNFSSMLQDVYTSAQTNNISIKSTSYTDGQTVIIEAAGASQAGISTFVAAVKASPRVNDVKQELTAGTATGQLGFRLTLTLKPLI